MDARWPLIGREGELAACRQVLSEGNAGGDNAGGSGAGRGGTGRDGTGRDGAGRDGTGRDGAGRGGAGRGGAGRGGAGRGGVGRDGAGGIVFAGETGVGLTALAHAAADLLRDRGCHVTWLSGMAADSGVPLCALAPVLPPGWRPEDHPLEVINAVAGRFAEQAGAALVIDDAHLLDPSSAALVAQLALRRAAFVVLTVHRGQPVHPAISMLWKDFLVRRIDVPPLPGEALDKLMDLELGGAVDGVTRHRLRQAAAGHPAVLRELLASGVHSGALSERFGVWRWKGDLAGSLRVTESVASRLETLPTPARRVLEVVAVAGGQVPLSMVEQLADPGALAEAERSGLLRAESVGRRAITRLVNPLHGHAIRELTPATTARATLARLVAAMTATPMRRWDDAVRVARWQHDAGVVSRPEVLLPAARLVRHSDPALAEWCARRAREAGHGADADLLLAQMLELTGRPTEAATVLDGVAAAEAGKGAHAATAAIVHYWGLGSRDRAEAALDLAETEPDRALAEALRTWILLFDGDVEGALRVARTVLLGRYPCELATVWATAAGAGAAGLLGRWDEAHDMRERGLAVAASHPWHLPWARALVGYGACAARFFCGDIVGAGRIAEEGYQAAASAQSPLLLAGWALSRGMLEVAAGRVVTAQTLLREATALIEETDIRLHAFCLAQLAGAAALAGQSAVGAPQPSGINDVLRPWHERAAAWVLVGDGRIGEAVARLTDAAERAGSPAAEAYLLYDLARLGAAAGVEARLTELADRLGSPFARALAVCAGALAAADHPRPDLIARAAKALADLGHTPLAAEAMSVAARAARRLGHRSRALLYVEEAAALSGRCEGLRTPLLTIVTTPTLTPREREILIMAAGHTSPQIAASLGVAVSTVNNHLANAYAKLGIAGRRELVALLGMDSE